MIIKKWSGSCSGGFSLNEYCKQHIKKEGCCIQEFKLFGKEKKNQQRSFMVSILTQYHILLSYANIKNCLKYTVTDCSLQIAANSHRKIFNFFLCLRRKRVQRRLKANFL